MDATVDPHLANRGGGDDGRGRGRREVADAITHVEHAVVAASLRRPHHRGRNAALFWMACVQVGQSAQAVVCLDCHVASAAARQHEKVRAVVIEHRTEGRTLRQRQRSRRRREIGAAAAVEDLHEWMYQCARMRRGHGQNLQFLVASGLILGENHAHILTDEGLTVNYDALGPLR